MTRAPRRLALALAGLLAAVALATAQPQQTIRSTGAVEAAQPEAPQPETIESGVRFGYVDVFIDSHDAELAVYQVELAATAGDIRIVGVEGGDPTAFASPPRYDPAALAEGERIILGDFSTDAALPTGKSRIARIHLRIEGPPPALALTLAVAGDAAGERIDASTSYTTSFQTQNGSNP